MTPGKAAFHFLSSQYSQIASMPDQFDANGDGQTTKEEFDQRLSWLIATNPVAADKLFVAVGDAYDHLWYDRHADSGEARQRYQDVWRRYASDYLPPKGTPTPPFPKAW